MAQSLSNVLVHLVTSTQGRRPVLSPGVRSRLFPYMAGTLSSLGNPCLIVGGVEDHVHMLFALSRTESLSKVVERVKTRATKYVKAEFPELSDFSWQAGYAAFSVGQSEIARVRRYIEGQEEHHRKLSFKDELLAILREQGIEPDERYLWD